MKNMIAIFLMFFSLIISNKSYSQFNTLMPLKTKKTDSEKISDSPDEKKIEKKTKRSLKEIFKITTKRDLKNEIDSLKELIMNVNNPTYSDNDSINRNKFFFESPNTKYQNKNYSVMYNFIEEPKDEYSKIVMPLNKKLTISSNFGNRIHPIFGTTKFHNGIDLKANYENVYSVMNGIVSDVGWDPKGGGNYIKIKHFNRFETSYLHLSEIYYRIGERVNAGFIIGKSGNSGNSTGPHLHFSVKEFGQLINPTRFLNDLIKVNNLITLYNDK